MCLPCCYWPTDCTELKITARWWTAVPYASTKFREIQLNVVEVHSESIDKEGQQDSGEVQLSGLGMNTETRLLFFTNWPIGFFIQKRTVFITYWKSSRQYVRRRCQFMGQRKKLCVAQLLTQFLVICGIRKFLTVCTNPKKLRPLYAFCCEYSAQNVTEMASLFSDRKHVNWQRKPPNCVDHTETPIHGYIFYDRFFMDKHNDFCYNKL